MDAKVNDSANSIVEPAKGERSLSDRLAARLRTVGDIVASAERRGVLALVAFTVVVTVVTVLRMMAEMNHGLDLSDEGSYLTNAQPHSRSLGTTFYGRYTSLLFFLADYDVARFRVLGLIVLAAAGVVCGIGLAAMVSTSTERPLDRLSMTIAGLVGLNAALLYYFPRLLTPSYNWLVVTSILWGVGWLGVWWWAVAQRWRDWTVVAATQVATGAFLAFMAKYAAGPALFVVTLVVVGSAALIHRRWSIAIWRFAIPAGSMLAGLILFHFLARSGPSDSLEIIRQGADVGAIVDPAKYSLSGAIRGMWDFVRDAPNRTSELTLGVAWLPILGPLISSDPAKPATRTSIYGIGAIGSLAIVGFRGLWVGGQFAFVPLGTVAMVLLVTLFAVALAEVAVMIIARLRAREPGWGFATFEIPLVAIAVVGASLAIAFGSGNGPLIVLSFSLGLALMAVAAILFSSGVRGLTIAASIALLIAVGTALVLDDARDVPYRQLPVAEQTVAVQVGVPSSELLVSTATAEYLTAVQGFFDDAGFQAGTPILDFSNFTPGAVWAVGGRAPISGFLAVGNLPTTNAWAEAGLSRLDPEFAASWLITGSFPGSADPTLVSILGRQFPADYKPIGEAVWWHTGELHTFWRPTD